VPETAARYVRAAAFVISAPGRAAEVNSVRAGSSAAQRASGAADQRTRARIAREGADSGTRTGTQQATRGRAVASRVATGAQAHTRKGQENKGRLTH
jgi:hypothetical protein